MTMNVTGIHNGVPAYFLPSHTNLPLKLDILSPRPEGGEIESGKEKCLVSMGYQYYCTLSTEYL